MTVRSEQSIPITITLNLTETDLNKVRDLLAKRGFNQHSIDIHLPQVTFRGQFNGKLEDLLEIIKSIREKRW